ncbi:beta-N-acetylhexosaminidase [Psychromicrobium lacuslunae]|uniref:beta-N-acetylhexosaminidase n=1 Tax=Psychromicrobium lacuslunae TaxID=1618207 RepID=UPI000696F27B|nr:glycoside hydrolase family 20 protein [Psychromicrobium lacuslunae]
MKLPRIAGFSLATMLVAALMVAVIPPAVVAAAAPAPAIAPTVRQFTANGSTSWKPGTNARILVDPAASASLTAEAQLLSIELGSVLARPAIPVASGTATNAVAGDVLLSIGAVTGSSGQEAYRMVAGATLGITGPSAAGVFYGGRSLLQSLRASAGVPSGTIVDWPDRPIRTLNLDIGRKFYSKTWIQNQIKSMAWMKLNTLQLHFSEDEGFRIESKSHPEIVSSQKLSQQDVKDIVAFATKYHITVVPDFDVPSHMKFILNAHPELRLVENGGLVHQQNLDISQAAARTLVMDIINEFLPLFPGPYWHIGMDEYVDLPSADDDFQQLLNYAIQKYGSGARVADALVGYANELNVFLRSKGKTVQAWNDEFYRFSSKVKLASTIQITHWTNWDWPMAPLKAFLDGGHQVINYADSYLYYVIDAAADGYPPSAEDLYNEWSVGVFSPLAQQDGSELPQTLASPVSSAVLGAAFSVWSENPGAQTEAQVAAGIAPVLWAMAQKIWRPGNPPESYLQYKSRVAAVGTAP